MSAGHWSSSMVCWLALFVLMRMVSFLRALEAHCRICARVCTGTAVQGWRMVLCVRGGTSGWCLCMSGSFECGSGSVRLGDAISPCGVACARRHVRCVGLGGGGEWSPVVGVCVTALVGCQRLPCGSASAAAMMYMRCSHDSVGNAVLMSSIRKPLSQRDEGVPVSSHLRRASCKASMCPRVMQMGGNSWGCLSPRRRCRVVLMAYVPHYHAGRWASS